MTSKHTDTPEKVDPKGYAEHQLVQAIIVARETVGEERTREIVKQETRRD